MKITRRAVLAGAALLRTRARGQRKLRIAIAGGHPGDPEYGCGGTYAHASQSPDRYYALQTEVARFRGIE